MEFQLPSLQGQTPTDFALRAGLYAASGALASQFSTLTVMHGAIAGLVNSLSVQIGQTAIKTDDTASQKILASMAPLALSTALMTALAPRLSLPLSLYGGITLFLCNAAGEIVKIFALSYLAAPVVPEKAEEIKDLSDAGVRKLHADYANQKDKVGAKALPALHARFYALDLPLPEEKIFAEMRKANEKFEITELALPQSEKDVQDLSKDQLPWLAFSLLQHGGVSKLDFKVQAALLNAMKEIGFSFYLTPKTPGDLMDFKDDEVIQAWHTRYKNDSTRWISVPPALKEAFNKCFTNQGLTPISLTFKIPSRIKEIGKMNKEQFQEVYDHYNTHREEYDELHRVLKLEFNKKVSEFHFAPLN
ncbi:hypothetical protein [Simkania sp.]|uniref:hypothetical protein n=1 Tax=Simkania sp. TaxID=34094 RepID=UPI003B51A613